MEEDMEEMNTENLSENLEQNEQTNGIGVGVLWSVRSTNGRWGMSVVGPTYLKKFKTHYPFPIEGRVEHLGRVGGISTWRLFPEETKQWVLPTWDIKVHGGARILESMGLQSNNVANLVLLSPMAIIEEFSYKRRGSTVYAYINGVRQDNIPGPVLLALGLIQAEGKVFEVEPPPPLEGAMAEALKKAFPHLAK